MADSIWTTTGDARSYPVPPQTGAASTKSAARAAEEQARRTSSNPATRVAQAAADRALNR